MIRSLIPLAQVRNVPRSVEFYEKIGFRLAKTFAADGQTEPTWASLESDRAELMIARGEPANSVLFYIFCDDVPKEHERLRAAGITVSEISYPFYAPRGEFRIDDPDGYTLIISHT